MKLFKIYGYSRINPGFILVKELMSGFEGYFKKRVNPFGFKNIVADVIDIRTREKLAVNKIVDCDIWLVN